MHELLQFVLEHGYAVLFAWVLAEQVGFPLPAIPVLLAAGAIAGTDQLHFSLALLYAVIAAVIADLVWYEFGRRKGASVLRVLCRISLEPDSCVRRTESFYERYGERSLLWAKFVPGLNTAAPPVAGMFGMPIGRFLLFDLLGSFFWAGAFLGAGWLFSDQLEEVAHYAERFGFWFVVSIACALAAYIGKKYHDRRAFLRSLVAERITTEELYERLKKGTPITIVDLRHPLDALPDPRTLPGAIRMTPEELRERHIEIPRDRGVVLYCT